MNVPLFCERRFLFAVLFVVICQLSNTVEAKDLPVKIDVEVVEREGESRLLVKVVNTTSGEVVVRKNLVQGFRWRAAIIEEGAFTFLWGSGQARCGVSTEQQCKYIRQLAEDRTNAAVIQPGEFYGFTVPFDGAFQEAKVDARQNVALVAQLELIDVVLSSPDANEGETVRLYNKIFSTPQVKYLNGKWKPYRLRE